MKLKSHPPKSKCKLTGVDGNVFVLASAVFLTVSQVELLGVNSLYSIRPLMEISRLSGARFTVLHPYT